MMAPYATVLCQRFALLLAQTRGYYQELFEHISRGIIRQLIQVKLLYIEKPL